MHRGSLAEEHIRIGFLIELSYLESDSDSVSFNREVETALLVVNRGEVAVDNSVLDI